MSKAGLRFIIKIVCLSFLVISGLVYADAPAEREMVLRFREGVHYKRLNTLNRSQPPVSQLLQKSRGKVQVVEFFSYGCHWCHRLDPYVSTWVQKKSTKIDFVRVPVAFNATWQLYGATYYTAERLGVVSKIHTPLFEAIQTAHNPLNTDTEMQAFFVSQGVNGKQFDEMLRSFSVAHDMKFAEALARTYQITGVPTVIVNGKKGSYATDTAMAGDGQSVFDVVDFLIEQEGLSSAASQETTHKK